MEGKLIRNIKGTTKEKNRIGRKRNRKHNANGCLFMLLQLMQCIHTYASCDAVHQISLMNSSTSADV